MNSLKGCGDQLGSLHRYLTLQSLSSFVHSRLSMVVSGREGECWYLARSTPLNYPGHPTNRVGVEPILASRCNWRWLVIKLTCLQFKKRCWASLVPTYVPSRVASAALSQRDLALHRKASQQSPMPSYIGQWLLWVDIQEEVDEWSIKSISRACWIPWATDGWTERWRGRKWSKATSLHLDYSKVRKGHGTRWMWPSDGII